MPSAHPRLSKPPLVEAVFEIRFSTETAYGLIPGRMFDELSEIFPQVEELQTASLPLDVPLPVLVRHRFRSQDGTKLFQTGQGVLSVNHVAYTHYDDLRADTERVIAALIRLQVASGIHRLGLRYINQVALDRDWSSITTLTDSVPETITKKIRDRRFHYGLDYTPDRMNLAVGNLTSNGQEKLQLDIDFFRENEQLPPLNADSVLGWLDKAHEHVYEVFTSLLTEEYLGEIR